MSLFSSISVRLSAGFFLWAVAVPLHAQTSNSVPIGSAILSVAAGNGTTATDSFITVPLLSPPEGNGRVVDKLTDVGSGTLSNSNAGWTPGAFAVAGSPHFVRITSGTARGRLYLITANTDTQLTLDTQGVDLTTLGLVSGTDTCEIFPGDTLLTFFGTPGAPHNILGGATPSAVADRIQIVENGAWVSYFYNTTAGQWRRGSLPVSQNNKALSPGSPILYSRVGNTALTFTVIGRVPDNTHVMMVGNTGDSAVSTFFPVDQSLISFGFQTLANWKKVGDAGITINNADKIFLLEAGSWIAYHYNATLSQWRRGSLPVSQNGKMVPAFTGILFQRSGSTGNTALAVNLPYNLN